eukprot:53878_1
MGNQVAECCAQQPNADDFRSHDSRSVYLQELCKEINENDPDWETPKSISYSASYSKSNTNTKSMVFSHYNQASTSMTISQSYTVDTDLSDYDDEFDQELPSLSSNSKSISQSRSIKKDKNDKNDKKHKHKNKKSGDLTKKINLVPSTTTNTPPTSMAILHENKENDVDDILYDDGGCNDDDNDN